MLRDLEALWTAAGEDRAAAAARLGVKDDTLKRKLGGQRGLTTVDARTLANAYGAELVVLKRDEAENLVRNGLRLSRLTQKQRDAFLDHYRADLPPDPRRARTA